MSQRWTFFLMWTFKLSITYWQKSAQIIKVQIDEFLQNEDTCVITLQINIKSITSTSEFPWPFQWLLSSDATINPTSITIDFFAYTGTSYKMTHSVCDNLHLANFLAAHSSVLAWRIPWTEEPGRHSPWDCKGRTRFSD